MATIGEVTRPGFVYDSATDTWIPVGIGPHAHTPAAIGAIASSLVTTKGDLIVATGSGTVVRQGVGADGSYLVADSVQAGGVNWAGPSNVAGKNAIINGGMDFFQRGSFSTLNAYALDRWFILSGAGATVTQSTAKVTPNSQYMMLMTATGTQQIFAIQAIESKNAIYYAGKTVTLSAYAAGLTTTTNSNMALQYSTTTDEGVLGAGWAATTFVSGTPDLTLSATVTRFSATFTIPSNAKSLRVQIVNNAANITVGQGIYLGDVQLELGSVATAFSRAGGSIGGELALCQRYFQVFGNGTALYQMFTVGTVESATNAFGTISLPVTMRILPSAAFKSASGFNVLGYGTVSNANMFFDTAQSGTGIICIGTIAASGMTPYRAVYIRAVNDTTARIELSGEL
jgi:hypothetical protein